MKKPRIVIEIEDGVIQAIYGDLVELEVKVHEDYLALDRDPPDEVEYSYDTKHVDEVFDADTES